MRVFTLNMQAYHYLEKYHFVYINETGDFVAKTNPRAQYLITLDNNSKLWIYYHLRKVQGTTTDVPGQCIVKPGFDRVSKFNPSW